MILEVHSLTGGYLPQPIIQGLDLSLQQGEWLSLLGANGSGKSTLLRLLSRILPYRSGHIYLNGKSIHSQSTQAVARQLAILPQQSPVPVGLTVAQLVSLGRSPHQSRWQWDLNPADRQAVEQAIAQTHLESLRDRPVEQLSGGERQRAFLALTLAQNPQVLLLDEPTTFLDLHHQLELLDLLKHLNQVRQLTLITVLHDLNLALRYSDRLALLDQGQLVALGPPEVVITPTHLRQVFGIEGLILNTPMGLQICPLSPTSGIARSRDGPAAVRSQFV